MTTRRLFPALLCLSLFAAVPAARADDAPQEEGAKPAPAPKSKKKAAAKKKGYDYERSKYKSRDMADEPGKSYRFNEKGEAVDPDAKKKAAAAKKKKRSEPPEGELGEKPGACSSDEGCAEKKTEADAL